MATVAVNDAQGRVITTATTAPDGTYSLPNLPEGTYLLRFGAPKHISEWFGGGEGRDTARPIHVTTSSGFVADKTLRPGGTVSGLALQAGEPVYGQVKAYAQAEGGAWTLAGQTNSGSSGSSKGWWTISGLPTEGPIKLSLTISGEGSIVHWLGDVYARDRSRSLSVPAGETVAGVDLSSPGVTTITGKTTNAYGRQMSGTVRILAMEDGSLEDTEVSANSHYSTGFTVKVPAGPISLRAVGGAGQERFMATYLGDVTEKSEAKLIDARQGFAVYDIDIAIQGGQGLTGHVVGGEYYRPLEGVTVKAFRSYDGTVVAETRTDSDGAYELRGLGAWTFGDVTVRLSGAGTIPQTHGVSFALDGTWSHLSAVMDMDPLKEIRVLTPPTITGMSGSANSPVRAGDVLTVEPGTYEASEPVTTSYTWACNYSTIPGEVESTYTVRPEDEGCLFQVTEKAMSPDNGAAYGRAWALFLGIETTGAPTVVGRPVVGETLSVSDPSWSMTPEHTAYQWFRGDEAIGGAVGQTYMAGLADAGKGLWVSVTASRKSGSTESHSERVSVKSASKLRLHARANARSARISYRLETPGVTKPGGQVRLLDGGQVVHKLRIAKVGMRFAWREPLEPGRHRLTLRYSGSQVATATVDRQQVRITR